MAMKHPYPEDTFELEHEHANRLNAAMRVFSEDARRLASRYPPEVVGAALDQLHPCSVPSIAVGMFEHSLREHADAHPDTAAPMQEIREREEAEERERMRQERRRARAQARAHLSERLPQSGLGLPPHAFDAVIRGRLEDTKALTAVRRWLEAEDASPWLLLGGPKGVGKTVACAAAMAHLVEREHVPGRPEYVAPYAAAPVLRPDELARVLSPTRFRDDDLAPKLTSARLVVLDDLGVETHPHATAALLELLERRSGRRTLVTTNLPPRDIHDAYEPRLVDRLQAAADFVRCAGESLRVARQGWG